MHSYVPSSNYLVSVFDENRRAVECATKVKARAGGEKGTTPVTTAFVQKIAEGKTSYELSWKVKVMIKKTEREKRYGINCGR